MPKANYSKLKKSGWQQVTKDKNGFITNEYSKKYDSEGRVLTPIQDLTEKQFRREMRPLLKVIDDAAKKSKFKDVEFYGNTVPGSGAMMQSNIQELQSLAHILYMTGAISGKSQVDFNTYFKQGTNAYFVQELRGMSDVVNDVSVTDSGNLHYMTFRSRTSIINALINHLYHQNNYAVGSMPASYRHYQERFGKEPVVRKSSTKSSGTKSTKKTTSTKSTKKTTKTTKSSGGKK